MTDDYPATRENLAERLRGIYRGKYGIFTIHAPPIQAEAATEIERLRTLNAELLAMLKILEWAEFDVEFEAGTCPECGGIDPSVKRFPGAWPNGHAENCELAILIAHVKQEPTNADH